MKAKFTFMDQTLGYALEKQNLGIAETVYMKQRLATLAQMVFDISFRSFLAVGYHEEFAVRDVRVCLEPDCNQIARVRQGGGSRIKVQLSRDQLNALPLSSAKALCLARDWGMTVSLHMIDGWSPAMDSIQSLNRFIYDYGVSSLVFDDACQVTDPVSTSLALQELQQQIACSVEYHGQGRKGLATGNALSAMKSGVRYIATSIGGIEGQPAFEEVLMGGRYLLRLPLNIPRNLAVCCEEILSYIGQGVALTKPIIGEAIFAHESGIHVDGVQKSSDLYEPFTPETVGLIRKIVIGKHSGKAAIELKLKEMGIFIQPAQIAGILEKVRKLAIFQKSPVKDWQLQKLACEDNYEDQYRRHYFA